MGRKCKPRVNSAVYSGIEVDLKGKRAFPLRLLPHQREKRHVFYSVKKIMHVYCL